MKKQKTTKQKKEKEHKKVRPYCLTLFTDLGSWGNKTQYVDYLAIAFKIHNICISISFNQYQYYFMITANLYDKLVSKYIHLIVNKTIH